MNPETREGEEELFEGKILAEELVKHVLRMGASAAKIPVTIEGEIYKVKVANLLRGEE